MKLRTIQQFRAMDEGARKAYLQEIVTFAESTENEKLIDYAWCAFTGKHYYSPRTRKTMFFHHGGNTEYTLQTELGHFTYKCVTFTDLTIELMVQLKRISF